MYAPDRAHGMVLACLVAGPVFVISAAAAGAYLTLPRPIRIEPRDLASLALLLLPVLIGATAMRALAERIEVARAPITWAAVGALCGAGLAWWSEVTTEQPELAFALIVTSTLCARLCRPPLRGDA
jgi:hypothetical protein